MITQDTKRHPDQPKPVTFPILGNLHRAQRDISLPTRKKGNVISNVTEPDEWAGIEFIVDSGACTTVMPVDMCRNIAIVPGKSVNEGVEYEVANRETITNLGECRCLFMALGSTIPKRIVFQVADVHKPLLSISCCAGMGFDCYLGRVGGHLEDTVTGEQIPLQRKDNLYTMRVWVRKEPDNPQLFGGLV